MKKTLNRVLALILILLVPRIAALAETAATANTPVVTAEKTAVPAKKSAAPAEKQQAPAAVTVTAAATVAAVATAAPAVDLSKYQFEDVIITGTKTKLKLKDSPVAAAILTDENLNKGKNVVYLDDTLSTVAGAQVRNQKGTHSTSVAFRGIPEWGRSLVLLDGFSIQNVNNARPFWNVVPVDLIDRIEIVRGPFSSLYGKYAIGGVVNVFTKEPEVKSLHFKASYDSSNIRTVAVSYADKPIDQFAYFVGYENTLTDGDVNTQYLIKSTKTVTYTAATQADGYKLTSDSSGNTSVAIVGQLAKTQVENHSLNAKIYYLPSADHKFSLLANYSYFDQPSKTALSGKTYLTDHTTGAPIYNGTNIQLYGTNQVVTLYQSEFFRGPGYNGLYSGTFNYNGKINDILSITAGVQYKSGPSKHTVDTIGNTATIFSGYGTTTSDNNLNIEKVVNLQAELNLESHKVIVGGVFDRSDNASDTAYFSNWTDVSTKVIQYRNQQITEELYAGYIQDAWKIFDPLTAYLGGRYDSWTVKDGKLWDLSTLAYDYFAARTRTVFSPKISLVYKPVEDVKFRASAGRAFNPPAETQLLTSSYTVSGTNITQSIASPYLNPEVDDAWEAGTEIILPTKTSLSATYFANYLTDLIYQETTITYDSGIKTTTNQYVNAGKGEIKGVEVEVKQPLFEVLTVFGNYTYSDSRITQNSAVPASVGKQVPNTAQHTGAAGIELVLGKFDINLTEIFSSKRYSKSDNTDYVNGVQGSYDPFAISNLKISYEYSDNAKITFGIDNVWNSNYYSNYKNPGRSFNAGVSFKFV